MDSVPADDVPFVTWRDLVASVILALAEHGGEFDSLDVRDRCAQAGIPEPGHPNMWGAVYSGLHREGHIEPAGWSSGRRKALHSSGVRVWVGTRNRPAEAGEDR